MAGSLVTNNLVASWSANDWSSGTTWVDNIAGKTITFSSAPSSKTTDGIELTTSITFTSETLSSLGVSYPCSFEWLGRIDGTWSTTPGDIFGIGPATGTWGSCIQCYSNTTSSAGVSIDMSSSRTITSSLMDSGIEYHILITVNSSGTTTLYVNSSTAKGTSTDSIGQCNKYYISNNEGSGRFYGAINRMSLWSTCLSDTEITTLFGDGVNSYTIDTTITNGTLINPTTASMIISEGDSATITFQGDTGYKFQSMTINDISVTPTEQVVIPSTTVTYSTNYAEYTSGSTTYSIDNAFDTDTSTFFWSSEVQTSGKYILINFSQNINLSAFSVDSSHVTSTSDCICSGTQLQVSSDNGTNWTTIQTFSGEITTSFTGLDQSNINAIRIYWTSGVNYWCSFDTISMTYTATTSDDSYSIYTYTISNITEDKIVKIIFSDVNTEYYVKVNGNWKKIITIYRKIANRWVEWDYTLDSTRNYIYKG